MRAIYVDKHIGRGLAVLALRPLFPGVALSPISPSRYAELPEPELPGPRWIRVKNRMCGICASDLALLRVEVDPRVAPLALPAETRKYLGHEVVGTVVETGPGVTRVAVGDRVMMDSRFQGPTCLSQELARLCPPCERGDHALCESSSLGLGPRGVGGGFGDGFTAHETEVRLVPQGLTDEQAVLTEPMSVSLRAVLRRPPAAGERALVVGGGTIGLGVVGCLRAVSPRCFVTVFARHPHQEAAAHRMGADSVFLNADPFEVASLATGARVYEGAFGNRMALGGFDVVYDCAGTASSLGLALRLARAGGAVVLVGVELRPLTVDLTPVWYQEVDLLGVFAHGGEQVGGERRTDLDLVTDLMAEGRLRAGWLVTHRFPLERWREAVRTASNKRSGALKVVFEYG